MVLKGKWKSATVSFVASVLLTCFLMQTIDCYRLKKIQRLEGRKDAGAHKIIGVQQGAIVFGKYFVNGSELQTKNGSESSPSNVSAEDEAAYQADSPGWSPGQIQDASSKDSSWKNMATSLRCVGDHMKFRAVGPGASQFALKQEHAPPMPLSQVPSTCGYSMKRNSLALAMMVPFDGCNMVQEGGCHVLPLLWNGIPVSLRCPTPDAHPATAAPKYPATTAPPQYPVHPPHYYTSYQSQFQAPLQKTADPTTAKPQSPKHQPYPATKAPPTTAPPQYPPQYPAQYPVHPPQYYTPHQTADPTTAKPHSPKHQPYLPFFPHVTTAPPTAAPPQYPVHLPNYYIPYQWQFQAPLHKTADPTTAKPQSPKHQPYLPFFPHATTAPQQYPVHPSYYYLPYQMPFPVPQHKTADPTTAKPQSPKHQPYPATRAPPTTAPPQYHPQYPVHPPQYYTPHQTADPTTAKPHYPKHQPYLPFFPHVTTAPPTTAPPQYPVHLPYYYYYYFPYQMLFPVPPHKTADPTTAKPQSPKHQPYPATKALPTTAPPQYPVHPHQYYTPHQTADPTTAKLHYPKHQPYLPFFPHVTTAPPTTAPPQYPVQPPHYPPFKWQYNVPIKDTAEPTNTQTTKGHPDTKTTPPPVNPPQFPPHYQPHAHYPFMPYHPV